MEGRKPRSPHRDRWDGVGMLQYVWRELGTDRARIFLLVSQALGVGCGVTVAINQKAYSYLESYTAPLHSMLGYVLLALLALPFGMWRSGPRVYMRRQVQAVWLMLLLGFLEVHGAYFIILSLSQGSQLPNSILNLWTLPIVTIISVTSLGVRYRRFHLLGLLLSLPAVVLLLFGELPHLESLTPDHRGDTLITVGATLVACGAALQQYLMRTHDLLDVFGGLGFWATLWSGLLLLTLEQADVAVFLGGAWDAGAIAAHTGIVLCFVVFVMAASCSIRHLGATGTMLALIGTDGYQQAAEQLDVGHGVTGLTLSSILLMALALLIYSVEAPTSATPKQPQQPQPRADRQRGRHYDTMVA